MENEVNQAASQVTGFSMTEVGIVVLFAALIFFVPNIIAKFKGDKDEIGSGKKD